MKSYMFTRDFLGFSHEKLWLCVYGTNHHVFVGRSTKKWTIAAIAMLDELWRVFGKAKLSIHKWMISPYHQYIINISSMYGISTMI